MLNGSQKVKPGETGKTPGFFGEISKEGVISVRLPRNIPTHYTKVKRYFIYAIRLQTWAKNTLVKWGFYVSVSDTFGCS